MTTPSLVQSTFQQFPFTSTSTQLAFALNAAPTVGNLLVAIVIGYNAGVPSLTGGWTQLLSTSDNTNQAVTVFTRTATSGDVSASSGAAYTLSNLTDVQMYSLYEIANSTGITANHGSSADAASQIAVGFTTGYPSATTLRLVATEFDTRGPRHSALPSGWTLLSPSTYTDATYPNHGAEIFSVPSTSSSTTAIGMTSAVHWPIWLDLVITGPVSPAGSGTTYVGGVADQTVSSVTLYPSQPPTVGNWFFTMVAGHSDGFSPPAGWTQLAANIDDSNNATWVYGKQVTQTDANTYASGYTWSGMSDVHMLVQVEVSGASGAIAQAHGSATSGSPTITIPGTAAQASNLLRFFVFEWDNRGPQPQSNTFNGTQQSPGTFYDTSFAYHSSVFYQVDGGTSGDATLTLNGNASTPVYLDVTFLAAAGAAATAVAGRVVWFW